MYILHLEPMKKKTGIYLRFNQASFVYGVFRTEKLKRCWVPSLVSSWDLVLILSILKEGDLHVVDEVLMHRDSSGVRSNSTIINQYKRKDIPITDIILPFSSLAWWCVKNVGFRFFLKNLDWFILLTIYGWRSILLEIAHASKNK